MSIQDPLLASYSYISPNLDGALLGPFCVECMNRSYSSDSFHFHSDISEECGLPIFLHTKLGGMQYKINGLLYLNGSQRPFQFRKLFGDVELILLDCVNGCHKENEHAALQTTEQPPPKVVVPLATATPSSDVQSRSEKEPIIGLSPGWAIEHGYPFLKGRQTDEGEDVITREELESVLAPWRPLISKMKPTIGKMKDILALPPTICTLCGTKEMDASTVMEHSTTKRHISKVYSSGLVFSLSLDLEMVLGKVREAALLVDCPIPPNSTAVDKQLTVCRSPSPPPPVLAQQPAVAGDHLDLIVEANFPLLAGYEKDTCDDALTPQQVEAEISSWRPLNPKLISSLREVLKRGNRRSCEQASDPGATLQHSMSIKHIRRVYQAQRVLSRSKDIDVALAIFRELAEIAGASIPAQSTTEAAQQQLTVPLAGQPVVVDSSPCPELRLEASFPLLRGYERNMCYDALTPEEVEAELGPWRLHVQTHMATFREVMIKMDFPELMFCTFCKKTAADTGSVMQHFMSFGHIGMVHLAGRVFSRSKDMNVILGILQEFAEMVGIPCPTRLTATDAVVDHRMMMKTVFWSSEIELTNSLKDAPPFPFLNGYKPEECAAADVMSRKELEEEAENIAAMRAELKTAASVDNGDKTVEFHRVCIYCNKFKAFTWDVGCLQHNLAPAHMEKVLSSGAVFSRSKDYKAAYNLIRGLYQLPLSDTAPPAVVTSTVGSTPAPVARVKPLESRPVQEVLPHRDTNNSRASYHHTELMGKCTDMPVLRHDGSWLSYRNQNSDEVLSLKELLQICSNFRNFAPQMPPLCVFGGTACSDFVRTCAPTCERCRVKLDCVCQMITHFFSNEHCNQLLLSRSPFFREDIKKWTDVVDRLMTWTSMPTQLKWRTNNCWTNVPSVRE